MAERYRGDLSSGVGWRFWRIRDGYLTGISADERLRQRWSLSGITTVTRACYANPRHVAPEVGCDCGLYVVTDRADALSYLRGMNGRHPSTAIAFGKVEFWGPARTPTFGINPPNTVRVSAARVIGEFAEWHSTGVASFDDWVKRLGETV